MNIRLFILGLPGSGKGTISNKLIDALKEQNVAYYNVGEILRSQADTDQHIRAVHASGGLVRSDRVFNIFDSVLSNKAFICDGSPRRPEEASFILQHPFWKKSPGKLLFIDVPQNVAFKRLLSRGRFDDTESIIKKRFEDFNQITLKSIELFRQANALIAVDGNQNIENIIKQVTDSLAKGLV